jgi:DNA replicative helicase MCM subunit Mcm2 (Cdc46/Mcm family)
MKVWVRGELTRQCTPGGIPLFLSQPTLSAISLCDLTHKDIITLDAVFLPTPYQGYKGVRAGLLADTYLEGMRIVQHKKSYADYVLTPEIAEEIENAAQDRDIYTRLSKSIAPEISFVRKRECVRGEIEREERESGKRAERTNLTVRKYMDMKMLRRHCY